MDAAGGLYVADSGNHRVVLGATQVGFVDDRAYVLIFGTGIMTLRFNSTHAISSLIAHVIILKRPVVKCPYLCTSEVRWDDGANQGLRAAGDLQ